MQNLWANTLLQVLMIVVPQQGVFWNLASEEGASTAINFRGRGTAWHLEDCTAGACRCRGHWRPMLKCAEYEDGVKLLPLQREMGDGGCIKCLNRVYCLYCQVLVIVRRDIADVRGNPLVLIIAVHMTVSKCLYIPALKTGHSLFHCY